VAKTVAKTKKPDPDSSDEPKTGKVLAKDKDAKAPVEAADATGADIPEVAEPDEKPATDDTPKKAEPAAEAPVATAPTPTEPAKRGGFGPALIGGILAAALGFLAARTEVLDAVLPDALKSNDLSGAVAALEGAGTKQDAALAALKSEVAAIDQPDMAAVNAQLAAITAEITPLKAESEAQQARLQDIEARLGPMATRLEDLEKRPMTEGASDEAIAAYDRELAALRDAVAAQRADAEKMIEEARASEDAARALEENAASAARHAQNQAIATRLHGALDSGAAYGAILAELAAAGVVVPEALNASANDGVATLASLSESFPNAARAALSAARSDAGDGGGLGGFLQRQLGARSVEPREGEGPDAILSRAEAAVTGGDLEHALADIATLPETARTAMQGWVDIATIRLTALKAADDLSQSLISN